MKWRHFVNSFVYVCCGKWALFILTPPFGERADCERTDWDWGFPSARYKCQTNTRQTRHNVNESHHIELIPHMDSHVPLQSDLYLKKKLRLCYGDQESAPWIWGRCEDCFRGRRHKSSASQVRNTLYCFFHHSHTYFHRFGATGELTVCLHSLSGLQEAGPEVTNSKYFTRESSRCDFEIGTGDSVFLALFHYPIQFQTNSNVISIFQTHNIPSLMHRNWPDHSGPRTGEASAELPLVRAE